MGVTARDRPVFYPELGQWFAGLREAKRWTQRQTVTVAQRKGLVISLQSLRWIEEGKIKNPEPDLLKGLATLYRKPYVDLVGRFVAARYDLEVEVAGERLKLSGGPEPTQDSADLEAPDRYLADLLRYWPPLKPPVKRAVVGMVKAAAAETTAAGTGRG